MLIRIFATLSLAMALVAPSYAANHQKDTTDFHKAAEVSNLMSRVESNAIDIREQAARLRSYNRMPESHSWQLHADELNRISGELDNVAALFKKLKPLKPNMTFRQSTAFNQLISASAKVSDATEAAIQIINKEKVKIRVAHPDYEGKVNAIYNQADTMAAQADNVEDWAEFIKELQESSDD